MGVSITYFGKQKAIFANQDDGIFSAIPITFDESVLTLETYTEGLRKFVKAGSVVKHGSTVKGITAEEYEITDGPINGRVVLEGYVYVENLTEGAAEAMSLLPKIVPIPYGKIIFAVHYVEGLKVTLKASGTVWTSGVATSNFTLKDDTDTTGVTITEVARHTDDNSLVTLTFAEGTKEGDFTISAIAAAAVVGSSGKVVVGLPIKLGIRNSEVITYA